MGLLNKVVPFSSDGTVSVSVPVSVPLSVPAPVDQLSSAGDKKSAAAEAAIFHVAKTNPDPTSLLVVEVRLHGRTARAFIDSGCSHVFLASRWLRDQGIQVAGTTKPMNVAFGDSSLQAHEALHTRPLRTVIGSFISGVDKNPHQALASSRVCLFVCARTFENLQVNCAKCTVSTVAQPDNSRH